MVFWKKWEQDDLLSRFTDLKKKSNIKVNLGVIFILGAVHKLRLQKEGVGGQKNQLFVNFHTIENVSGGG